MSTAFERAFRAVQNALGLNHYRVTFESVEMDPNFADITPEPTRCFAHCRYDAEALDKAGETLAIATHEALHLLMADLVHGCSMSDKVAAFEEERTVMRLEKIVMRGIFAGKQPTTTPESTE